MHRLPQLNGNRASTGLIQWTSVRAVQANQKSPVATPKLPIMAGYRRCSGGRSPQPVRSMAILLFRWYMNQSQTMPVKVANSVPIPRDMKTSPTCSTLKPYVSSKTRGKDAKKAYRTAKSKPTYKLRNMTMGSVNSIWNGRIKLPLAHVRAAPRTDRQDIFLPASFSLST